MLFNLKTITTYETVYVSSFFFLVFLAFTQTASAQAWKNAEKKQAINREATVKKRIINNENAFNRAKDETLKQTYEERIQLLKSCEQDIVNWNQQIEANEKTNSHRYNLLTNIKLGKADAIQNLVTIRTSEILYELFGGDFKEEPLSVLNDLDRETRDYLQSFDEAVNKVQMKIQ